MENNNSSITPLQRFFRLLQQDRQQIGNLYIYALFGGLVNLSLPLGIQAIINFLTGGQISTSWIVLVVLVIVGIIVTGIMQIMQLSISENLQQKIFARAAFEFAYRIPKLRYRNVDKMYLPELMNRFFDTLSVQKGLSKILIDFSASTLQIIFGLILLSFYHPFFILFSILLVALIFLIFRFTGPVGLSTSLKESKYKYEVAHWLEETARHMETFKLAASSKLPLEKTDQLTTGYLESRKKHFKVLVWQFAQMIGFKAIVAAGLLVIGGLLVFEQQMNLGQFVAAEIVIILVMNAVEKLIMSMETIYDVLTALEKMGHVTDLEMETEEKTHPMQKPEDAPFGIKGDKLSLTLDNKKLLQDLNFTVKPGEKVCIVGPSGSGKSLFLYSVAGLYDNFEGSLLINDIPLKNINPTEYRKYLGDCLIKEGLINASFIENITLGKPEVTWDEVKDIVQKLNLQSYVHQLSQGYETQLHPGDRSITRAIKQQILWARGLVGNPKLVLWEDNAIYMTKAQRDAYWNTVTAPEASWTLLAVSNNPDFARNCDKILGMEDGRIVAEATPNTMAQNEWFTNFWNR